MKTREQQYAEAVKFIYGGKGCWHSGRTIRRRSGKGRSSYDAYPITFQDGTSEFVPAGKFNSTALCKDCQKKLTRCSCG